MLKFIMMMMLMMIMKTKNLKMTMMIMITSYSMTLQFNTNSKTSIMFSSDTISFWITMMSILVTYTLLFIDQKKNNPMNKKTTMIMMMILMMTFNTWNFMTFYLLFEMSMINIMIIIISWGYQPERTEAIMFMILMTLMFSLPFLMAMMENKKSLSFWFINMNLTYFTIMSFMFIFMVKMPVYFLHFWLPKAHVEAPVQGSMILAAILLKLGCYGMIRMNLMMMKLSKIKTIFIPASIYSMIILSMSCIMQIDLKTLIAYSSIVHMMMVFINIMLLKTKSIFSSMMIIIGHGLCSAAMFMTANIMYENSKSRSMILNKSILNMMPPMTLMWFMVCMNNAPMPPSMNMLGELISFKNIMNWSEKMFLMILVTTMVSSMYSIYLFYIPTQGKLSKTINKEMTKMTKNNIILTSLMMPAMMTSIKPSMLIV